MEWTSKRIQTMFLITNYDGSNGYVTVDQLFEKRAEVKVKRGMSSISRGTIDHNLDKLVDEDYLERKENRRRKSYKLKKPLEKIEKDIQRELGAKIILKEDV